MLEGQCKHNQDGEQKAEHGERKAVASFLEARK
jgi:hypothetical protein